MERKQRSIREITSSSSLPGKKKEFESSTIQSNADNVSWLVGRIVEKGISDDKLNSKPFSPTPPPKITVLPFPVARHRSDGPHWAPIESKKVDHGDIEDDENDGADSISDFAKPVKRKQKKNLDLSNWKELMSGGDSAKLQSRKSESIRRHWESNSATGKNMSPYPSVAHVDVEVPMEVEPKQYLNKRGNTMVSPNGAGVHSSVAEMEIDKVHTKQNGKARYVEFEVERLSTSSQSPVSMGARSYNDITEEHDRKMENKGSESLDGPTSYSRSMPNNFKSVQGPMSVESEIDAENRAHIERMSAEEIAEAQAEIMEKMDPALLSLLKKRGQGKLKRQQHSSSGSATDNAMDDIKSENKSTSANVSLGLGSDKSQTLTSFPKDTQDRLNNGVVQNSASANSSLWEAWSGRVEAVRNLKYSLDGTPVENDGVPEPKTGYISVEKVPSADNAAERDFLRTEGDPGAAGYSIKEAIALTRSVVPGQRALALHLLASVLERALYNICRNQAGSIIRNDNTFDGCTDWEAVWAFALGPEPELVLALRMSLDDNHNSVVLACVRVIQCILSYDLNEHFFDNLEKMAIKKRDIFTAPVFRSKPEIDVGFLRGGFWKYNAKPSNILLSGDHLEDDETKNQNTVQDDVIVAGQDFAAGLVRMGVLPRLRYLLETEPTTALEECIISILTAIARHSPASVNAIMNCERLVQTVVQRFTANNGMEVRSSQIKSVCLLKVLARSDKRNCIHFVKNRIFQAVTWQLYQYTYSLDQWVKSGKDNRKLSSALMVEQLRLWKVCIQNGHCISYFSDIFPALCLWLNPPTIGKLMENNVLSEFALIANEAYLVLEALAGTLPNFYTQKIPRNQMPKCDDNNLDSWSWSYVAPMVDLALKWISSTSILFTWKNEINSGFVSQGVSVTPLLWVYSAVMQMLSRVLEGMTPENTVCLDGSAGHLPWLPEFVPKIGLELIKNKLLSFSSTQGCEYGTNLRKCSSFAEELSCLRRENEYESSLASVCCLRGLMHVVSCVDNLVRLAKAGLHRSAPQVRSSSSEGNILEHGILKSSLVELRYLLDGWMKLVASEWNFVQSIEMFGRGGPAPGVGLGWGASGGGFWSTNVLLAQTDAQFVTHLLSIFHTVSSTELPEGEVKTIMIDRMNTALAVCLTAGPTDKTIVEEAFNIMLQIPALQCLNLCIRRRKSLGWEYSGEDFINFSTLLASHFRDRWLLAKKKSKDMNTDTSSRDATSKKNSVVPMETIHEDVETSDTTSQDQSCNSLPVEWSHQHLPLPLHWFLSPIATICDSKHVGSKRANLQNLLQDPSTVLEVAKAGLFFILGIESMSTSLSQNVPSPVLSVPLIWKLHSLSVILLVGMGILEEEKSRDVYESLQDLYGQYLDDANSNKVPEPIFNKPANVEFLRFQSDVHDSYLTFVETLVEHYAAVSYGDILYGRQVAIYLHRSVEAPVRLAAWNALSNARVLELLPPIQKCYSAAEGYLGPIESNEDILEAYVKSWVSGSLDRAAIRGSVTFAIALHHLSSFIFLDNARDKLTLRDKLVKSLLRDYSRKQNHEGMMLDIIRYKMKATFSILDQREGAILEKSDVEERFKILKEACAGNSSLLTEVEKLKSLLEKQTFVH